MMSLSHKVRNYFSGSNGIVSLTLASFIAAASAFGINPAFAQNVFITPDTPFIEFDKKDEFIFIERNQDSNARIPEFYTQTSRQCPPFCIQPMSAGEGVITVGELEVLEFLENKVSAGTGALIDARLLEWYQRGTIPGATSIPFTVFEDPENNPFLVPILTLLGGEQEADNSWKFNDPLELVLFCNGNWCGQSHRAIKNLLSVGYPPSKLQYYRGGMQAWLSVGLPTTESTGSGSADN